MNKSPRLKPAVRREIEDGHNQVWVSVVSGWEVAIKIKTRKLRLKTSLEQCFELAGMPSLDERLNHVLALGNLPLYHKDPFDRMLICQAQVEGMTLITADSKLEKYRVKLVRV